MNRRKQYIGAYDYPRSGMAIADGKNFLKEVLAPGRKARQLVITTLGENAKVVIDGRLRKPDSSRMTENGLLQEYFCRHVAMYSDGSVGCIESAVVSGNAVNFRAQIST